MTDADRWGDKRKIDGIIDLLTIKEVRQIELDVIVAEVSLLKLRDIGFDFTQQTPHVTPSFLGSQSGFGTLFPAAGGPASGIFRYVNGSYSLTTLYRMLQNKDVTEILAQPRLVMKNGRSGGFLAGGEFPVVQTLSDSFSVEFKPFGVRLDFVPTLNWSDRIDLRVFPEVSEIDQTCLGSRGSGPQGAANRKSCRDEGRREPGDRWSARPKNSQRPNQVSALG